MSRRRREVEWVDVDFPYYGLTVGPPWHRLALYRYLSLHPRVHSQLPLSGRFRGRNTAPFSMPLFPHNRLWPVHDLRVLPAIWLCVRYETIKIVEGRRGRRSEKGNCKHGLSTDIQNCYSCDLCYYSILGIGSTWRV